MFTANRLDLRTASCVALAELRHTSSIGGSSDREQTALTVIPYRTSSWLAVITTTPLMKLLMTCRKAVVMASRSRPPFR